MRTCIKCKIDKPETEFKKDGRYSEGFADKCAVCYSIGTPQVVEDPESHAGMWLNQKCHCLICQRKTTLTKIYADLDPETGEVLALLCKKCARLLKQARKNRRVWDAVTAFLSDVIRE